MSEKDFYKDEIWILNKLNGSKNKKIKETLNKLENKKLTITDNNSGEKIIKKFRYTDPKVLSGRKLIKLSQLFSKFKIMIDKHKKINERGLVV